MKRSRASDRSAILDRLRDSVANFEVDEVRAACLDALEAGILVEEAILKGMTRGMDIVGRLYEEDTYLLPELIMAAEAMNEGLSVLKPHIKKSGAGSRGVVALGSVEGDIHDIGKNLVGSFLTAAGFDVQDLGVDVSPEEFLAAVKDGDIDILGLSSLMTTTRHAIERTIEHLERSKLRSNVKIVIGGGSVNRKYADRVGADGYAEDALAAVRVAKRVQGL
ncbi:MAG: corrinoid protein [Nitrososphaerales archaeon]